jgi:PAP2 superfamily
MGLWRLVPQLPPLLWATIACAVFAIVRGLAAPNDRERAGQFLLVSFLATPLASVCMVVTTWLSSVRPVKYDLYVYGFDQLFGQPSFAVGRFLFAHPWLLRIGCFCYDWLVFGLVAVYAAYLWGTNRRETGRLVKGCVLNFVAAVPIYCLAPVCGPRYAFAGFPYHQPEHVIPHPLLLNAPPNCIPSVHTSSALMLFWFAKRWRLGQVLGGAFLLITLMTTMGIGEHYLFDLFAAVPYAYAVYRAAGFRFASFAYRRRAVTVFCQENSMLNGTLQGGRPIQ